jgi:hypothetical protein
MTKSWIKWVGNVAHMGARETHVKVWSESKKGKDHLEDKGVDGTIILKWIIKKLNGRVWSAFIWFAIGTSGGLL